MTAVTGRPGPAPPTAATARPGAAGLTEPAGRGGPGPAAWRRWRAAAVLVAIILAGGVVIAMLQAGQAGPMVTGAFDPRDVGPLGTHALAALLTRQGKQVFTVDTAAVALARSDQAHAAIVIADPGPIAPPALRTLAAARADLLLIAPGPQVLHALTHDVTLADEFGPVRSRPPQCAWPGARLAGSASMGGLLLRSTVPGAWRCYPARHAPAISYPGVSPAPPPPRTGYASLVRYRSGGRVITVIATGEPLSNQYLGQDGNAALALNLLGGDSRIVWLMPGPETGAGPGPRSVNGLVPEAVNLVIAELAVALVLAAGWRMRRFGPLVFEPLPVVVRASETAEGHGRLYRSRRARDRAAAALRDACLARITARIGLPPATPPDAIGRELAGRTGRDERQIRAILWPAPRDDAALVKLATDLDTLEGQVLTS